ncbi:DNA mismatch repair protein MutL [Anaerolineae bacterium]|nr:DNA mismatch repair protein MutL [Anaerolineae bacterium]
MPGIAILPEHIANKIAAGEVVQRPESVVKELIENSIDAGATEIELHIRKAGKSLIRVIDNGSGMSPEDALLSIRKHATSKITSEQDLDAIRTLGFRGEALSSIVAVAQFELRTERMEDELGTLIRIDDSSNIQVEKGSFPKGTSISVKNLFYNTPARRNFLKTDATEMKHISDTFERLALSHPEIAFRLFIDEGKTYDYAAGTAAERVQQVFGAQIINALITVKEQTEAMSLTGFLGKPNLIKKSKGDQYLFLNNRFVVSKQVNHAVFTAYENILEKGDYPFFVLFLQIDPQRIDVNVHPSKLEVRFEDDRNLYNFVLAVIKKHLASYDLVPGLSFSMGAEGKERMAFTPADGGGYRDFSDRPSFQPQPAPRIRVGYSDDEIDSIFQKLTPPSSPAIEGAGPFEEQHPQSVPVKKVVQMQSFFADDNRSSPFIIQLHNKYILIQIKSGLMIIDQHVAHERILYERAKKSMEEAMAMSQPLLFPREIILNPGMYMLAQDLSEHLKNLGFDIRFAKHNSIIIEGIPQDVQVGSEEHILKDILQEYAANYLEKGLEISDSMAKSYSCKMAIKAGDRLSDEEMRVLIDELFSTSMPYVCPHGRPVVVKIALDEFDRRFGRTS